MNRETFKEYRKKLKNINQSNTDAKGNFIPEDIIIKLQENPEIFFKEIEEISNLIKEKIKNFFDENNKSIFENYLINLNSTRKIGQISQFDILDKNFENLILYFKEFINEKNKNKTNFLNLLLKNKSYELIIRLIRFAQLKDIKLDFDLNNSDYEKNFFDILIFNINTLLTFFVNQNKLNENNKEFKIEEKYFQELKNLKTIKNLIMTFDQYISNDIFLTQKEKLIELDLEENILNLRNLIKKNIQNIKNNLNVLEIFEFINFNVNKKNFIYYIEELYYLLNHLSYYGCVEMIYDLLVNLSTIIPDYLFFKFILLIKKINFLENEVSNDVLNFIYEKPLDYDDSEIQLIENENFCQNIFDIIFKNTSNKINNIINYSSIVKFIFSFFNKNKLFENLFALFLRNKIRRQHFIINLANTKNLSTFEKFNLMKNISDMYDSYNISYQNTCNFGFLKQNCNCIRYFVKNFDLKENSEDIEMFDYILNKLTTSPILEFTNESILLIDEHDLKNNINIYISKLKYEASIWLSYQNESESLNLILKLFIKYGLMQPLVCFNKTYKIANDKKYLKKINYLEIINRNCKLSKIYLNEINLENIFSLIFKDLKNENENILCKNLYFSDVLEFFNWQLFSKKNIKNGIIFKNLISKIEYLNTFLNFISDSFLRNENKLSEKFSLLNQNSKMKTYDDKDIYKSIFIYEQFSQNLFNYLKKNLTTLDKNFKNETLKKGKSTNYLFYNPTSNKYETYTKRIFSNNFYSKIKSDDNLKKIIINPEKFFLNPLKMLPDEKNLKYSFKIILISNSLNINVIQKSNLVKISEMINNNKFSENLLFTTLKYFENLNVNIFGKLTDQNLFNLFNQLFENFLFKFINRTDIFKFTSQFIDNVTTNAFKNTKNEIINYLNLFFKENFSTEFLFKFKYSKTDLVFFNDSNKIYFTEFIYYFFNDFIICDFNIENENYELRIKIFLYFIDFLKSLRNNEFFEYFNILIYNIFNINFINDATHNKKFNFHLKLNNNKRKFTCFKFKENIGFCLENVRIKIKSLMLILNFKLSEITDIKILKYFLNLFKIVKNKLDENDQDLSLDLKNFFDEINHTEKKNKNFDKVNIKIGNKKNSINSKLFLETELLEKILDETCTNNLVNNSYIEDLILLLESVEILFLALSEYLCFKDNHFFKNYFKIIFYKFENLKFNSKYSKFNITNNLNFFEIQIKELVNNIVPNYVDFKNNIKNKLINLNKEDFKEINKKNEWKNISYKKYQLTSMINQNQEKIFLRNGILFDKIKIPFNFEIIISKENINFYNLIKNFNPKYLSNKNITNYYLGYQILLSYFDQSDHFISDKTSNKFLNRDFTNMIKHNLIMNFISNEDLEINKNCSLNKKSYNFSFFTDLTQDIFLSHLDKKSLSLNYNPLSDILFKDMSNIKFYQNYLEFLTLIESKTNNNLRIMNEIFIDDHFYNLILKNNESSNDEYNKNIVLYVNFSNISVPLKIINCHSYLNNIKLVLKIFKENNTNNINISVLNESLLHSIKFFLENNFDLEKIENLNYDNPENNNNFNKTNLDKNKLRNEKRKQILLSNLNLIKLILDEVEIDFKSKFGIKLNYLLMNKIFLLIKNSYTISKYIIENDKNTFKSDVEDLFKKFISLIFNNFQIKNDVKDILSSDFGIFFSELIKKSMGILNEKFLSFIYYEVKKLFLLTDIDFCPFEKFILNHEIFKFVVLAIVIFFNDIKVFTKIIKFSKGEILFEKIKFKNNPLSELILKNRKNLIVENLNLCNRYNLESYQLLFLNESRYSQKGISRLNVNEFNIKTPSYISNYLKFDTVFIKDTNIFKINKYFNGFEKIFNNNYNEENKLFIEDYFKQANHILTNLNIDSEMKIFNELIIFQNFLDDVYPADDFLENNPVDVLYDNINLICNKLNKLQKNPVNKLNENNEYFFDFNKFIISCLISKNYETLSSIKIHSKSVKEIIFSNQSFYIKLITYFIRDFDNLENFFNLLNIHNNNNIKFDYQSLFFEYLKKNNKEIINNLLNNPMYYDLINLKSIFKNDSVLLENVVDSISLENNFCKNPKINYLFFFISFFDMHKILIIILNKLTELNFEDLLSKENMHVQIKIDSYLLNLNPKFLKISIKNGNYRVFLLLLRLIKFNKNWTLLNLENSNFYYHFFNLKEEIFKKNNINLYDYTLKYNKFVLRRLIFLGKLEFFLDKINITCFNSNNKEDFSLMDAAEIYKYKSFINYKDIICNFLKNKIILKNVFLNLNNKSFIEYEDFILMQRNLDNKTFEFAMFIFLIIFELKPIEEIYLKNLSENVDTSNLISNLGIFIKFIEKLLKLENNTFFYMKSNISLSCYENVINKILDEKFELNQIVFPSEINEIFNKHNYFRYENNIELLDYLNLLYKKIKTNFFEYNYFKEFIKIQKETKIFFYDFINDNSLEKYIDKNNKNKNLEDLENLPIYQKQCFIDTFEYLYEELLSFKNLFVFQTKMMSNYKLINSLCYIFNDQENLSFLKLIDFNNENFNILKNMILDVVFYSEPENIQSLFKNIFNKSPKKNIKYINSKLVFINNISNQTEINYNDEIGENDDYDTLFSILNSFVFIRKNTDLFLYLFVFNQDGLKNCFANYFNDLKEDIIDGNNQANYLLSVLNNLNHLFSNMSKALKDILFSESLENITFRKYIKNNFINIKKYLENLNLEYEEKIKTFVEFLFEGIESCLKRTFVLHSLISNDIHKLLTIFQNERHFGLKKVQTNLEKNYHNNQNHDENITIFYEFFSKLILDLEIISKISLYSYEIGNVMNYLRISKVENNHFLSNEKFKNLEYSESYFLLYFGENLNRMMKFNFEFINKLFNSDKNTINFNKDSLNYEEREKLEEINENNIKNLSYLIINPIEILLNDSIMKNEEALDKKDKELIKTKISERKNYAKTLIESILKNNLFSFKIPLDYTYNFSLNNVIEELCNFTVEKKFSINEIKNNLEESENSSIRKMENKSIELTNSINVELNKYNYFFENKGTCSLSNYLINFIDNINYTFNAIIFGNGHLKNLINEKGLLELDDLCLSNMIFYYLSQFYKNGNSKFTPSEKVKNSNFLTSILENRRIQSFKTFTYNFSDITILNPLYIKNNYYLPKDLVPYIKNVLFYDCLIGRFEINTFNEFISLVLMKGNLERNKYFENIQNIFYEMVEEFVLNHENYKIKNREQLFSKVFVERDLDRYYQNKFDIYESNEPFTTFISKMKFLLEIFYISETFIEKNIMIENIDKIQINLDLILEILDLYNFNFENPNHKFYGIKGIFNNYLNFDFEYLIKNLNNVKLKHFSCKLAKHVKINKIKIEFACNDLQKKYDNSFNHLFDKEKNYLNLFLKEIQLRISKENDNSICLDIIFNICELKNEEKFETLKVINVFNVNTNFEFKDKLDI